MSTTAAILIAALLLVVLGDMAAVHAILKRRGRKEDSRRR
jgi:hypothetical protein